MGNFISTVFAAAPVGLVIGIVWHFVSAFKTKKDSTAGLVTRIGISILAFSLILMIGSLPREKQDEQVRIATTPSPVVMPTHTPILEHEYTYDEFDVGELSYYELEDYYYTGIYDDWADANPFNVREMSEYLADAAGAIIEDRNIESVVYIRGWNAFAIWFTANDDRFYVYQDFPEDVFDDLISSSNPYSYYTNHIRGKYGQADKYFWKDLY